MPHTAPMAKREEYDAALADLERLKVSGRVTDAEYARLRGKLVAEQPMTGCGKGVLWVAIGIPVLVIGGCNILSAVGHNSAPSESGMQSTATVACRTAVKDQLKAPRTAKFSDESVSGSSGAYIVVGNVDAENSFGALVRSGFRCSARVSTATGDAVSADATVVGK